MTEKPALVKPPILRAGDRVGVISPSGPVEKGELQEGLETLRHAGFEVVVAPHVFSKRNYMAGEDGERLEDLHAVFEAPDIKGIFCARGGYGCLRLLDKIHYNLIEDHPKILVGYSDITALLMAVLCRAGLVPFHGPVVRELTRERQGDWLALQKLLSSKGALSLELAGGRVLKPGRAEGPLIGGNLSLLCHLVGTPFLPSLEGCILFLEDKGEPLYKVDRMLTHMALAGHVRGLAGLVLGGFEGLGDPLLLEGLLREVFSHMEGPVATGLPVGHGVKNRALPLGLKARLDTSSMSLSVVEPCFQE